THHRRRISPSRHPLNSPSGRAGSSLCDCASLRGSRTRTTPEGTDIRPPRAVIGAGFKDSAGTTRGPGWMDRLRILAGPKSSLSRWGAAPMTGRLGDADDASRPRARRRRGESISRGVEHLAAVANGQGLVDPGPSRGETPDVPRLSRSTIVKAATPRSKK